MTTSTTSSVILFTATTSNTKGLITDSFQSSDKKAVRDYLADTLQTNCESDHLTLSDTERMAVDMIRSGESESFSHCLGARYEITSRPAEDVEEEKRAALAEHLGCAISEVEVSSWDDKTYEAEGNDFLVLDDTEADTAAEADIRESVWAFNSNFLEFYVPDAITAEHLDAMRGDSCEGINDAFLALVEAGSGIGALVEAAISADGRGHFLAQYDFEEIESGNFLIYRTN